jgi:hypothetical protein
MIAFSRHIAPYHRHTPSERNSRLFLSAETHQSRGCLYRHHHLCSRSHPHESPVSSHITPSKAFDIPCSTSPRTSCIKHRLMLPKYRPSVYVLPEAARQAFGRFRARDYDLMGQAFAGSVGRLAEPAVPRAQHGAPTG